MTDNRALWELVDELVKKWKAECMSFADMPIGIAVPKRLYLWNRIDELAAILKHPVAASEASPKACSWYQCDEEGGSWDTTCGHAFSFTADGPEENNFTHCCFCGGTLDENPWVSDDNESDESMVRGKS